MIRFFAQALALAAAVVILLALVFLGIKITSKIRRELSRQHRTEVTLKKQGSEDNLFSVLAYLDEQECGADYPLAVRVANYSERTVKSLKFKVQAFPVGESEDVNAECPRCEWWDFNNIVPPRQSAVACYRWPLLRPGYEEWPVYLHAEVKAASVRFYQPGEYIPGN